MNYKSIFVFFVIIICLFIGNSKTYATILTFDDISLPLTATTDDVHNYGGFEWTHFGVLDTSRFGSCGYRNSAVSGTQVAYNSWNKHMFVKKEDNSPFNFIGGYFTSAWYSHLNLRIYAYTNLDDISPTYTETFTINCYNPTRIDVNYENISKLEIFTNRTHRGHFALDNFEFSNVDNVAPVPEPTTILLVGVGLIGLVGISKIKK